MILTTIVARHADKSGLNVSSSSDPKDCDPIFATLLHGKVVALVSFAATKTRRRKPYATEISFGAWTGLVSHLTRFCECYAFKFNVACRYIPINIQIYSVRSFRSKIVIKNLFQPWRHNRDTWPLRNFKYVSLSSLSWLHKRHMHLAFHGGIS